MIKLFKEKIAFCSGAKVYFSVAFLGKGKKKCYAYNENIEVAQL